MFKRRAYTSILGSTLLALLAQPGFAADDAKAGDAAKPSGPDRIFQSSEVTSTGSVTVGGKARPSDFSTLAIKSCEVYGSVVTCVPSSFVAPTTAPRLNPAPPTTTLHARAK